MSLRRPPAIAGVAKAMAAATADLIANARSSQADVGTLVGQSVLRTPLLGPEYYGEVLGSIEETGYYIHREGQMFRFQTKQNLYRRIAETANTQPQHVIDDRIRTAMADAYGSSQGFKVLQWAGADGSIPDQPESSIAMLAATLPASVGCCQPAGMRRISRPRMKTISLMLRVLR